MDNKNTGNLNEYIEMGYTALNAHDFDRAMFIFDEIIERHPERPAGYCGLGLLELERQNYKKARDHFERTIELDRNYTVAREKLAIINRLEEGGTIL